MFKRVTCCTPNTICAKRENGKYPCTLVKILQPFFFSRDTFLFLPLLLMLHLKEDFLFSCATNAHTTYKKGYWREESWTIIFCEHAMSWHSILIVLPTKGSMYTYSVFPALTSKGWYSGLDVVVVEGDVEKVGEEESSIISICHTRWAAIFSQACIIFRLRAFSLFRKILQSVLLNIEYITYITFFLSMSTRGKRKVSIISLQRKKSC